MSPDILSNEQHRRNWFMEKRLIEEEITGQVTGQEKGKVWVKFAKYCSVLAEEEYFIPV